MLLLLSLLLFQSGSQGIPPFETITTQSGLSNSVVHDIYQDSQGYVWIATDNGLNRFDGKNFKVFYHNKSDSTSLSSNVVRTIIEDKENRLWIGTFNGFNLFDRTSETFTRYTDTPDPRVGSLVIQEVALDADGRLWFNTLRTTGWFNLSTHQFTYVQPSYVPFSIASNESGDIWSLSNTGELARLTVQEDSVKITPHSIGHKVQKMYFGTHSNHLWMNQTVKTSDLNIDELPGLPAKRWATSLLETDSNTLWIGTEKGLYHFDHTSQQLRRIDFKESSSVLTESIRELYQDDSGGIWAGTLNGVFHFDPHQKPFRHISVKQGNNEVIMGLGHYNGTALVNILGQGVFQRTSDQISFTLMDITEAKHNGSDYVWDIAAIKESTHPIWLATNGGLLLYDPITGSHRLPELTWNETDHKMSFSILPVENKHVWVSSTNSIHKLDIEGRILKEVNLKAFTKETIIQDLALIGKYIFIATEGEGLIVYEPDSDEIYMLADKLNSDISLMTNPIWDLYPDGNKLWLGTNHGLYQLDTRQWTLQPASPDKTLSKRVIFSIEKSEQQKLWMGTEAGLASFDIQDGTVSLYDQNDGIKNTEFNRKSIMPLPDGMLWLGGVNGITVFDPNTIHHNPVVPPVYISNVQVITPDSVFCQPFREVPEVTLPWQHNTLRLSFIALNYTSPDQNQYQYRLQGHDPGWIGSQALNARYTQLPPGSYTFQVKAANNDGVWNPEIAALKIRILPPFWKTWWFQALIVIVVILLLWLAYRYRIRNLLKLERMRLRIAGDLHDEVGSGLSGIALTGDLLQKQLERGKIKPEMVDRITSNARGLASSLDAIVWLIDPEQETLGDLLNKSTIVAKELLVNTDLKIKDQIGTTDRSHLLSAEQKRNLFLLFKECFHNISKHATAQHAELRFTITGSQFIFEISDNGKGFDASLPQERNGIKSMQHRARELKALFDLISEPGKGTKIRLSMKLP